MKQQSEHLSDAEVERYGEKISPAEAGSTGTGVVADRDKIEGHLAECSVCSERVLSSQRARFVGLADREVKASPQTPYAQTPDCPGEDALRDLAAGLCSPEQGAQFAQHTAQCDRCGPLLRKYAEDFSDELSPEDSALVVKSKSSSSKWHKALTQRMLAESAPQLDRKQKDRKQLFSWRWLMAPAVLAACVLIAFGVWYSQRETPEKVEKLLAQAYTEQRTMEMRIPYARYTGFHQLLSGDAGSLLNAPPDLRKATDQIASHLIKRPQDPEWLLLSARLDLLDWHYKAALKTLDSIEDARILDSPRMLITRALAAYEKAEMEHDSLAYGQVVDLLGRTLQKEPANTVALFNQGLACEKLYLYDCATNDYERLLGSETDSGWSGEARERLRSIQEKKKSVR